MSGCLSIPRFANLLISVKKTITDDSSQLETVSSIIDIDPDDRLAQHRRRPYAVGTGVLILAPAGIPEINQSEVIPMSAIPAACLFGRGIRVFFTLNYTGDGDGFTFTMMNADPTDGNDITSIGGDPQGSELLAYAGDSREDPAGTTFLDNNRGRGIVPPKLAVEFDARTNFDQNFEDEAIKNYCNGPNLRQDTRNDPLARRGRKRCRAVCLLERSQPD
jgi:hypothetical protein